LLLAFVPSDFLPKPAVLSPTGCSREVYRSIG
jgi:hypothetical protein